MALLPRLCLAFFSNELPAYDALGYDVRARSIVEGKGFAENGKTTSFKPPLYSFFLAVIYSIFGYNYLAVRIVQSILGALTAVLIYIIALRLADRRVAFISGLLAVANISFIKSSEHLLSEVFSTFLLSSLVLSLIQLKDMPGLGRRILVGFIAGLIALTRSEMAFFLFFVYLGWLCLVSFKGYSKDIFIKDVALTFFVFIMIVSLWTLRNWRAHHSFVPLTTAIGINLYSSYLPPEGKLFGFTANDNIVKLSRQLNSEVEQSRFLLKEALKFIISNLNEIPRLEILKFAFFWSVFDWEIIGNGVYNPSYGFILPFFILGFIRNVTKWQRYLLLYAPVIYLQIMALLFYGSPRFRVPCEPFIIIFAALGLVMFFQRFSKKIAPSAMLTVFFIINLSGYIYSSQLKDFIKCLFVRVGLW